LINNVLNTKYVSSKWLYY